MYEKLEQCPVCKNKQFDNHMICTDHSVSGESFALVKCRKCKLVFTNPRPEESNLTKYYKSDQYISHTDSANSPINIIYKLVRGYTLSQKTKLITRLNNGVGSMLDYGCGTGDFVKSCREKGWQAFGLEPDNDAREIAASKNPSSILNDLKDVPENLDIISTWHVVEHISTINKTLKSLVKKLKVGGHLIIAVPNHRSYDAEKYQENWAAYDVPRHLYHFDNDSMEYLAHQIQLKIVSVMPMKFDAYYVSMLSEKYIGGNVLKAILSGYKSNSKANKNNQYSSLIYILKK